MAEARCSVGRAFARCPHVALDSCQYCGRPFCAAHTFLREGHDAVCTRKRCRVKHEDLARHLEYREATRVRNRAGLCGIDGCGPHPKLQCSLCEGHFCDTHVRERNYPVREGSVIIDRPMSVCEWCWRRRKIWRR